MPERRAWVLAGAGEALARLAPLVEAHGEDRPVRLVPLACPPRDATEWRAFARRLVSADAVLLVGDARLSPRRALPGIFARDRDGHRVALGWLPFDPARLASYASIASGAMRRRRMKETRRSVAWLSDRTDRALRLVDEMERMGPPGHHPRATFRWTAERLGRDDLLRALRLGPGAAVYVGHGLIGGWMGYGGIAARAWAALDGAPVGAVLSLSCHAASRRGRGFSFAEDLVLSGACLAALGAAGRTVHTRNAALARRLTSALVVADPADRAVGNLASVLRQSSPRGALLARYRICGDPLAPVSGDPDLEPRATAVFAPAPDQPIGHASRGERSSGCTWDHAGGGDRATAPATCFLPTPR